MKKVITAIFLVTTAASAIAGDISRAAGVCGAFYYIRGNTQKAELAIRHAENLGKMQVAAEEWAKLASTDPKAAYDRAAYACIMDLKISSFPK